MSESEVVEKEETWDEFVEAGGLDDAESAGDAPTPDAEEAPHQDDEPDAETVAEEEAEETSSEAWEIPLKVGGKESSYTLPRGALDDPTSEAYRDLVARLQKADDYDRPGGALDKLASRKAEEAKYAALEQAGIIQTNAATGQREFAPWFADAYKRRGQQPAQQEPAGAAERLDELYRAGVQGDRNAMDEYVRYTSATQVQGLEQRLAAQTAEQQKASLEKAALDKAERAVAEALDGAFSRNKDAFLGADGQTDEEFVSQVRHRAANAAWTGRSLDAGTQVVDFFASRSKQVSRSAVDAAKAELLAAAKKSRKKATTVLRGGPSSQAAADDGADLNDDKISEEWAEWARSEGLTD